MYYPLTPLSDHYWPSQEVEAEYCVANGHSHDAQIIYGDTDSVMVKFGPTDLEKVMQLGMLCRLFSRLSIVF